MGDELTRSTKWRRERESAPPADTPFQPWDSSVLVIYAVSQCSDEPSPETTRFVLGTFPRVEPSCYLADIAPNVMEYDADRLERDIGRALAHPGFDAETKRSLEEALVWMNGGAEWFLTQLEPPGIAELGVARQRGLSWEKAQSEARRRTEEEKPEVEKKLVLDGVRIVDGKKIAQVREASVVGDVGQRLVDIGECFGVDTSGLQRVVEGLGGYAQAKPTLRIILPDRRIGVSIRYPREDAPVNGAHQARSALCKDAYVRSQLDAQLPRIVAIRDNRGLAWLEADAGDFRRAPGEAPSLAVWSQRTARRGLDRAILESFGVAAPVLDALDARLDALGGAGLFGLGDEVPGSGLATWHLEYSVPIADRVDALLDELAILPAHRAILARRDELARGGDSVVFTLDQYALNESLGVWFHAAPLGPATEAVTDLLAFADIGPAFGRALEGYEKNVLGLRITMKPHGAPAVEVRLFS